MWMLTPENYQKLRDAFPAGSRRLALLKFCYSCLSLPVWFVYPVLLLLLWRQQDARLLRVVLVPATAFFLCTVLRQLLRQPRPYEQPGFVPLVEKDTAGLSCPSRHAASVTVITLACLYLNSNLGGFLAVLTVLICAVRVLAGVHHPRDVFAGVALSVLVGGIGFWLL